jgi:hypothetical protein
MALIEGEVGINEGEQTWQTKERRWLRQWRWRRRWRRWCRRRRKRRRSWGRKKGVPGYSMKESWLALGRGARGDTCGLRNGARVLRKRDN